MIILCYTWKLLGGWIWRVLITQRNGNYEVMDVLSSLIVVVTSQCIHTAKHRVVHLTYVHSYLSIIQQLSYEINKYEWTLCAPCLSLARLWQLLRGNVAEVTLPFPGLKILATSASASWPPAALSGGLKHSCAEGPCRGARLPTMWLSHLGRVPQVLSRHRVETAVPFKSCLNFRFVIK